MPYKGKVNHLWAQIGTEQGIFLLLQQDSSYLSLRYFRGVYMRSMNHLGYQSFSRRFYLCVCSQQYWGCLVQFF